MINPWLFYWMSIADNFKIFLFSLLLALIALILGIMFDVFNYPISFTANKIDKFLKDALLGAFICGSLLVAIPSKKVCMEMLIANEVTEERIEMVVKEVEKLMGVKDE